ncbi:MAG: oxygen-independent coproporphyrinogen III oxidase [Acidiferrobacteraceae bacterium]
MDLQLPSTCFDPDLIARYDVPGPRYTSYPPASHFLGDFDETAFCAEIERSQATSRPLSLYVHIPFCATVCLYCACTKIVTRNRDATTQYLEHIERELALYAPLFHGRVVTQIHWGGGTPTFLSIAEMSWLMAVTRRHFELLDRDHGEYSIEIDPRTVDTDTVRALSGMGFNRMSLGVQDFDPQVQKAVHRIQSEEQTRTVVEAARKAGFRSINVDLIYGLPYQSERSFSDTLDKVIGLMPDRLSVFNYAHLPHLFKMQRLIDSATLPGPEEKLQILGLTIERLTRAGYVYIGMDHFARGNDELTLAQRRQQLWRNFQGYSTRGGSDLVGFGMSAISQVGSCYAQNEKDLHKYYERLDAGRLPTVRGVQLGKDDLLRRDVIMSLICHMRIDFCDIEQRYGIRFNHYFASEIMALGHMVDDGLIKISATEIVVNDLGRMLIRNICMAFDHYQQIGATARGSRTI